MKKMVVGACDRLQRRLASKGKRHDYKRVWEHLAWRSETASVAVAGYSDEEGLNRSAEDSRSYLENLVGIRPDDVILEIGCGVGRVGAVLAPRCRKWIGCDVSASMLKHAATRLSQFDNVQLVEISGHDLVPIPNASADVVYCIVVFMHLDEWDRYHYVQEAYRVLKPGGRILINNVNLCSDDGWMFFEELCRMPPHKRPAYISKTSTPDELRTYLEHAGFQDINEREEHLWLTAWGRK